jgi:hypothetical protein
VQQHQHNYQPARASAFKKYISVVLKILTSLIEQFSWTRIFSTTIFHLRWIWRTLKMHRLLMSFVLFNKLYHLVLISKKKGTTNGTINWCPIEFYCTATLNTLHLKKWAILSCSYKLQHLSIYSNTMKLDSVATDRSWCQWYLVLIHPPMQKSSVYFPLLSSAILALNAFYKISWYSTCSISIRYSMKKKILNLH